LRREVGLFRERFQSLSAILQDLQGPRSPQSVLRSAHAVIANTLGADGVWVIDGRSPSPRPLLRNSDVLPSAALQEVRHCMRAGRILPIHNDDTTVYLVPLQVGAVSWGALAVRIPGCRAVDPEALRFLRLAASLLGGAAILWEAPAPKGYDISSIFQGWLSLSGLPSKVMFLAGEHGSGKRTLAERMHERYVGGGFASFAITGGDDEVAVAALLQQPGLRTLYVHDILRASSSVRALLLHVVQTNPELVLLLGTSDPVAPLFPDPLLSRAALVTIRLPALRERTAEIPSLVQTGLSERGVKVKLSSAAKALLAAHAWPGNYGELSKFIAQAEQALRLSGGATLTGQLTRHLLHDQPWLSLDDIVDALESHVLTEAMRRFDGNRAAAGRAIGMTPRQVSYKCRKYGLE
jgi:hypothetical protein